MLLCSVIGVFMEIIRFGLIPFSDEQVIDLIAFTWAGELTRSINQEHYVDAFMFCHWWSYVGS